MEKNNSDDQARAIVDRLGPPPMDLLEREISRLERNGALFKLGLGCLLALVVSAAVLVLLTNLWLGVVKIDGKSMTPGLRPGAVILTAKTDAPALQEVVSFYVNNRMYVKRVIAAAGDWVDIDAGGIVSVNGRQLEEPYVAKPSLGACETELPCQVPAGTVFVMGDNRAVSEDSRGALGTIATQAVCGRAIFCVWPLSQFGRVN